MNSTIEGRYERIASIDGLRALAMGLVFAYHAWPTYFPGAFIGVDIFFVISGFVITGALVRDGLGFRRFYIHRFFRIIPPTVPVIVFVLVCWALGVSLVEPHDALYSALSVMNWALAFKLTTGEHLVHFWSLGVEEQFYLIWPALLAAMIGLQVRPVIGLGILLLLGLVWQIALYQSGAGFERIYHGLDTRASQLIMGCLLYFLLGRFRFPAYVGIGSLLALFVAVFIVSSRSDFYLSIGIGLMGISSAIVVGNLAQGYSRWHAPFLLAPVQWAGSRSYAMYLWHVPFLGLFHSTGLDNLVVAILSAISTAIAAEASMRFIERPARFMRMRFDTIKPEQGMVLAGQQSDER